MSKRQFTIPCQIRAVPGGLKELSELHKEGYFRRKSRDTWSFREKSINKELFRKVDRLEEI
jgi:hypothetical protein